MVLIYFDHEGFSQVNCLSTQKLAIICNGYLVSKTFVLSQFCVVIN
jgi:hypothetical protein